MLLPSTNTFRDLAMYSHTSPQPPRLLPHSLGTLPHARSSPHHNNKHSITPTHNSRPPLTLDTSKFSLTPNLFSLSLFHTANAKQEIQWRAVYLCTTPFPALAAAGSNYRETAWVDDTLPSQSHRATWKKQQNCLTTVYMSCYIACILFVYLNVVVCCTFNYISSLFYT